MTEQLDCMGPEMATKMLVVMVVTVLSMVNGMTDLRELLFIGKQTLINQVFPTALQFMIILRDQISRQSIRPIIKQSSYLP